ncbi:MAG: selenoneine synthase SenA, partial [Candidatus Methylomirabilales bacterium]
MVAHSNITVSELAHALIDARSRTLALVADLTDDQLIGPNLQIVNPLLWEIGHVAWFQEKWVLRHRGKAGLIREDADALYDSIAIPHDTRWSLPLLSREETLAYMQEVLNRILERIGTVDIVGEEAYFLYLALFHEDMHTEAFTYTRQTLGYPRPRFSAVPEADLAAHKGGGPLRGDVEISGGTFLLGATRDLPFVFDNEKWAHRVEVRPFRIACAPVTNVEFAEFVKDKGYVRRELWSEDGWRWREKAGAEHPVYWQRSSEGRWYRRSYDEIVPLEEHHPIIHVNWFEAQAYCRWAGRRLPTEAEWELVSSAELSADRRGIIGRKRLFPWGDESATLGRANIDGTAGGCIDVGALAEGDSPFGCRQLIGNVWEWTSTDFGPYPGFVVDPYKEYSAPWFGTHKVLRGGSWATRSRMIRNTWRNYHTPERRDVMAGFRTCA